VGRHGAYSRDSYHRDAARDLRSHGIVEADRALAERLTLPGATYQDDIAETNCKRYEVHDK